MRGVVQGVGFRPFVHSLAADLGLSGWVLNDSGGVVTEVQGPVGQIAAFAVRLRRGPPLAVIDGVAEQEVPPRDEHGFRIDVSSSSAGARTSASPDVATCDDCLAELRDPADRRYRHPFLTCTHCGPRFTIITDLPYDRPTTTMADFPMCADCAGEYADPGDRRFHAQPIACPACGPRLEFVAPGGAPVVGTEPALAAARRLLAAGGVLAVKGLGGYHLACRARDADAVATLRARKRRGAKPFAVMVADLADAERLVHVDPVGARLLTGRARPIVLLHRRPGTTGAVAEGVAPGNPDVGILLPYTPLHHLLLGEGPDGPGPGPLVMTSGNRGGEPLVAADDEALERLAGLADGWLRHDRPIHVPCDDSVVRPVDGEALPIRRSRGYAPLPIALPVDVAPTLAAGAELKNTVCLGSGHQAWLSGHIGDMDDLATLRTAALAVEHLEHLTGVRPRTVAADAHPAYRSRAWAVDRAGDQGVRSVQHHHAHVAALMAEHGLPPGRRIVGVAFDGTGYGSDGAVWGGEVLLAGYAGFERYAHLRYVPLAGGDASVERPYRMALAHLQAAGVTWEDHLPPVAACPPRERAALAHQLRTGLGCVPTSSMGRLFDAIASLSGIRHTVDFEAQAAMELEARAREAGAATVGYRFGLGDGAPLVADPSPVVRAVVDDVRAGVPAALIAARFHVAVATLVVDLARRVRAERGLSTVGLTGGVFQNALLLSHAARALADGGFTVLRHRHVPPNDGGLALGQLVVAGASMDSPFPEER